MRILIVDDSSRLRRSLRLGLRKVGYAVDEAADGAEGLAYAQTYSYDAIVLDLMMPEVDGLTMLKTLRRRGDKTHVLILSAKDQVEDRVKGLQLGADDYLVKPFSFDELLARLQALIRRRYETKDPTIRIGSVEVQTAEKQVMCDGTGVVLTPREYAVLEYLACRRGRVVSRDILHEHLFDEHALAVSNVVDVTVCTLRRKLKDAGVESLVKTRRGFGYVIE